jgi:hypothetical protein
MWVTLAASSSTKVWAREWRVVEDAVGDDDAAGRQTGGDAADGGEGHHLAGAGVTQSGDVGAVVDEVRRDAVRLAVAGEEQHRAARPPGPVPVVPTVRQRR